MKKNLILLVITILTFNSCNESVPVRKAARAVYVAGWEGNVAKYWKNGTATNLSNGVYHARANSIFVSAGDIHIAGREILANGNAIAKYWKNGIPTNLTDGTDYAEAHAVFVSGSDVYVAGQDGNAAMLWENGIPTILSAVGDANSVFVKGSDVYVAGWDGLKATYWKNGIVTNLTDGTNGNASAHSIFVSGSDVYVAGSVYPENITQDAIYWKNGVATTLPDGGGWSHASSIFVKGSNVHVTGWDSEPTGFKVRHWNNGIAASLNEDDDESGAGFSIFVSRSDVYVAGHEGKVAKYWKNGVPNSLTNGALQAFASSIFVTDITSVDSITY